MDSQSLTPKVIKEELDRYVIGQDDAKKAVAIALRNRWRRLNVKDETLRDDIIPKNILMIGPTGCGKTEIARKLAKLTQSPFIKVEATKFTEIGYVGRDVEQIIRDLIEVAINLEKKKIRDRFIDEAKTNAEEIVLKALLGDNPSEETKEKFRLMLRDNQLNDKEIEIALDQKSNPFQSLDIPGMPGAQMGMINMNDIFGKGLKNKKKTLHVVAIDYGIKKNILRYFSDFNCKVTIVPCKTAAKDILKLKPNGIFLSNGPGDPAATGKYAIPIIQKLIKKNLPLFGICLGHQILALALGAKTEKMKLGHRGANHPVKNLIEGNVEITSQNHGFEVVKKGMPKNIRVTHQSLFDNSIEGIELKNKPVFSVQYHPESNPGPQDSVYLFEKFVKSMKKNAKKKRY